MSISFLDFPPWLPVRPVVHGALQARVKGVRGKKGNGYPRESAVPIFGFRFLIPAFSLRPSRLGSATLCGEKKPVLLSF